MQGVFSWSPLSMIRKQAILHLWILSFAGILCLITSVRARAIDAEREARLTLDPAHTTISFTLETITHTVHGTFKMKNATITIVPRTGEASGAIIVDAASGESGNGLRDLRMTNNVLEASLYPEIIFVPRKAEAQEAPQGQFHARLVGTLLLHGSSHELTLPLLIVRQGDDFTVRTQFNIPYVSWGLKDPSVLFLTVSKQVEIDITSVGHISWFRKPQL
jgi:polyisoprenoid-binding protein YceI